MCDTVCVCVGGGGGGLGGGGECHDYVNEVVINVLSSLMHCDCDLQGHRTDACISLESCSELRGVATSLESYSGLMDVFLLRAIVD